MSSVYGSSILNLDLLLDYNNLTNKPTIPQVGYVANGRNFAVALTDNKMFVNVPESAVSVATASDIGGLKIGYTENGDNYALKLDGDNEAFVTVPASPITVATTTDLGGIKLGFGQVGNNYPVVLDGTQKAYVVVDKTITPVSDPLPRNFELTADIDINDANDTTFRFEDTGEGSSDTTVYSQGITHTNNTNVFTVSTAGQYLISYFLQADDSTTPSGNARIYGYSCIRREQANGVLIYEYKVASEYLRAYATIDDMILCGTNIITFNAGEKFKIRYYRVVSQAGDTTEAVMKKSLSNLRIERIKYNAT